jgi:hypothetical protein
MCPGPTHWYLDSFSDNILLNDSLNQIAIKWKRRMWYTLESSTTCRTDHSQGHLREAHLVNEFCCSILLITKPNSQQLSRWQLGLRRAFVKN